ncbi:N-acetyltransferase family protein [Streptomyces sp. IPPR8]|uniref:GNAT family N-acetyltransferase n=1 Tax=Streptomyces sp. IPPR8 TaxID=3417301 RepID=UPI003D693BDD
MKIRVRDAHPADVKWMSENAEGWTVTGEKPEGAASLAEALHALIAEDPDQGVRTGWLHSSLQRAVGDEPGYVRLYELYVPPEFRRMGVARALVDELFVRVPDQEIVLSAWDRELYELWLKLGFSYVPGFGEVSGECGYYGDMVRPPVEATS